MLMAANRDLRSVLAVRWRATASGPFFDMADPPVEFLQALPADYLSAVDEFGGREGFIGETYLRLYRLEELVGLNVAYEVPALFPQVILFASNGAGEAFAFPLGQAGVLQVPFLPLSTEHAGRVASSFTEFVRLLAASGASPASDPKAVGMEVHERHPICFGGSPTDPENKVLVPAANHAELCRFWNGVYRNAVAQRERDGEQRATADRPCD
jgi:hypothetical protein